MRETILRRRDDRMKTVYPLSPNMNIMKRKIIDDEEEEDKSPIATQNQCGNRRMRREREREREDPAVSSLPQTIDDDLVYHGKMRKERERVNQTDKQTNRQTNRDRHSNKIKTQRRKKDE